MGTSKSDWKTVDRIFDMMKYLCRVRRISMPKLADKYDVSVRTIKRDIDVLGGLIPLEIKMGRYDGGVYVMDGYKWDNTYMRAEDIILLMKIKEIAINNEKLVLDKEELERLEKIITTYTMPS